MADRQNIRACFKVDRPGFMLDADLSMPGSGVTAIFGPSGSGKTTLLRCIAGLEHTARGFFSIDGEVWQDEKFWLPTHKRSLGYVFQEASLFPHLTVLGNLRYGMRRGPVQQQNGLDRTIELLGIGHLLNRKPAHLSGGERQRVGIARALVVNPRILLMDEPLASLDIKRKQEILPFLQQLHAELQIPILYVSHSADEVMKLADHLVILEQGLVKANGPLAETLSRLDLPIKLGGSAGTVLEAVIGAVDATWRLARIDFAGGSLWSRDSGLLPGSKVRVQVLASDVSLAVEHPGQTSIRNILHGRVEAIADDEHPGLALMRVKIGETALLAGLTKRAAAELKITLGRDVWVMVKSVGLIN
ncbi:MAG: molybdenum ABC transporter ATP-binding protein [Methylomonas sp.]